VPPDAPAPSLGERAFLREPGLAREARRSRACLSEHDQPLLLALDLRRQRRRSASHRHHVCRRTGPEDSDAPFPDERKNQLHCDGWLGERLRERHPVGLALVLLGTPPGDLDVRKLLRESLQELALPPLGFEKRHVPIGERNRDGKPRGATTRADVDDRAVLASDEVQRTESVVQEGSLGLGSLTDRGEARRREQLLEPAVEKVAAQTGM
jgi:hypothetical protein